MVPVLAETMTASDAPTGRRRLLIARTALARATTAATTADGKEVGGVLVGFRAAADVYVTHTLVVPADTATGTRYVSTAEARDAALAGLRHKHPDDTIGYVGTWHSHPRGSKASPTDKRTLRAEAADAPDLVAMLIVLRSRRGWLPEAYVGQRRKFRVFRRDSWVTPALVTEVDV